MSKHNKLTPLSVVVLLLGASAAIAGSKSNHENSDRSGISCEIREERARGGLSLRGNVSANATVSGTYQLRVTSSSNGGHVNLQQNGDFHVAPKQPAMLGQITLGSQTPDYEATLTLNVDGKMVNCSEQIVRSL